MIPVEDLAKQFISKTLKIGQLWSLWRMSCTEDLPWIPTCTLQSKSYLLRQPHRHSFRSRNLIWCLKKPLTWPRVPNWKWSGGLLADFCNVYQDSKVLNRAYKDLCQTLNLPPGLETTIVYFQKAILNIQFRYFCVENNASCLRWISLWFLVTSSIWREWKGNKSYQRRNRSQNLSSLLSNRQRNKWLKRCKTNWIEWS